MESKTSYDPKAPLSTKDVALLLMEHCKDCILEERGYVKDLINEKNDTVVAGLTKGLCDGLAKLAEVIKEQSIKIADLETSHNAKIKDLELKLDTFNSYFENSLNSLGDSLQTGLGAFNSHMKLCHGDNPCNPCQMCDRNLQTNNEVPSHVYDHNTSTSILHTASSPKDLLPSHHVCGEKPANTDNNNEHNREHHGIPSSPWPCFEGEHCDSTFQSEYNLDQHTEIQYHSILNVVPADSLPCATYNLYDDNLDVYQTMSENICNKCDLTFSSWNLLALHSSSSSIHAGPRTVHCTKCDLTFDDMRNLNVHTALQHKEGVESISTSNKTKFFNSLRT